MNNCKTRTVIAVIAAGLAAPAMAELPELRLQTGGIDIRLTAGAAAQGAAYDDGDSDTSTTGHEFDLFARLNARGSPPVSARSSSAIRRRTRISSSVA